MIQVLEYGTFARGLHCFTARSHLHKDTKPTRVVPRAVENPSQTRPKTPTQVPYLPYTLQGYDRYHNYYTFLFLFFYFHPTGFQVLFFPPSLLPFLDLVHSASLDLCFCSQHSLQFACLLVRAAQSLKSSHQPIPKARSHRRLPQRKHYVPLFGTGRELSYPISLHPNTDPEIGDPDFPFFA
ncbi:hypothetical protein HOY80DRAFT_125757 [Tuber brumale]|nr:hypothetical protein HOY80DRAFT_125757 [Tuber brumale]